MSATRLLVLGVVRLFQPVHGYVVRRELLTWNVDEWASVNPGSIYGALRTLAKGGYVIEAETGSEGARPARTTYRLTEDGEIEFFGLLRKSLWRADDPDIVDLRAALSFMWAVTREEVLEAMAHRANQIEGCIASQRFAREQIRQIPEKPEHVVELYHLEEAMLRGQLAWIHGFVARVQDGAYAFAGEPGVGGVWHDVLVERGVIDEHDAPLHPPPG